MSAVPLTLMRNPEEYAEKACQTLGNQAFQDDPTPCRMQDFILNSITNPVFGVSIWDMPNEEEEDCNPGRSRARSRVNPRRRLPSTRHMYGHYRLQTTLPQGRGLVRGLLHILIST